MVSSKPVVLHLGDPVVYNPELFKDLFSSQFDIVRPSDDERQRGSFMKGLKEKRWGDFQAIFRPHWNTGGEMGKWDKELISLLPESCKISASAGAGFDWVDTAAMAERGIVYCNGAQASTESVADMALWHIITTFRNLIWSQEGARSGDPEKWLEAHRESTETARNPINHVLGIIGLGNIGYRIATKAHLGLGMKIAYYDVVKKSESQEAAVKANYVLSVEELVSQSDCVLLATPFGGEKLITAELLAKFKKGSRFVNIARGMLVDEKAVADALNSGHLFAAGLDVFENEPHINPELIKMRNVSLTCHNAGGSLDTKIGFERLAMENIEGYLNRGREGLKTPVNLHLIK